MARTTEVITMSLPPELLARLNAEPAVGEFGRSYFIRRAVERQLRDLERKRQGRASGNRERPEARQEAA